MSELIKSKFTLYAPDGSEHVLGVYDTQDEALIAANAVQAYSDLLREQMESMGRLAGVSEEVIADSFADDAPPVIDATSDVPNGYDFGPTES